MNFFSHCHVASWTRSDPAFALGSMLPDFATMSDGRLQGSSHADVQAGIAHHHETDAVFHAAPTFVRLCGESAARMEAEGVRWGTSRAVAHVGLELLLDGVLLHGGPPAVRDTYVRALRRASPADLGTTLRWRSDASGARFDLVLRRLLDYGLPDEIGEPEIVFTRLVRILGPRDRLRIEPEHQDPVRREIHRLAPDVRRDADALMHEVRQGLGAPG